MNKNVKNALICASVWTFSALLLTAVAGYSAYANIAMNGYQIANVVLQWCCASIWWMNFARWNRKDDF